MPRMLPALLFCTSLGASLLACHRKEPPQKSASAEAAADLANGMYLATGIFPTMTAAETSAGESRILTDRYIYDPPSERPPPRYVAIDATQYVPFVFETAPRATLDPNGRTILSIALDANHTERLKEFTTRHLGKSTAMVVGGELVSVHKIKEPITGGKLQITSCGADVCKVLHSRLVGTD